MQRPSSSSRPVTVISSRRRVRPANHHEEEEECKEEEELEFQDQQEGLDEEIRRVQSQQQPQPQPNIVEHANGGLEQPQQLRPLKEDELSPAAKRRRCGLWSLGFLLSAGLIAVIVVFATGIVPNKDKTKGASVESESDEPQAWTDATEPPVPAVLIEDAQAQMDFVLAAMRENTVMTDYVAMLEAIGNVDDFKGKETDANENALIRAMAWLLHVNEFSEQRELVERFALAALYYETGGGEGEWLVEENWLSPEASVCSGWFGITCCGQYFNDVTLRCADAHPKQIAELDLHSNNLHGSIPDALSLLQDLHVLWLDNNKLSGPLKGAPFAQMTSLTELYVQHNLLTGPIEPSLRGNGILHTLFIQGNLLEGKWPNQFCPKKGKAEEPFLAFGLDCTRHDCPPDCCYLHNTKHCFEGDYHGTEDKDEDERRQFR